MAKFKIGDQVGVVIDGEILRGVVYNTYGDLGIVAVRFENGTIEKVPVSKLGLLSNEKDQEPEKKYEPVEKSEITITPVEFRNVATKLISETTKESPLMGLSLTIFTAKLHRKLFIEGDND